MDDTAQSALFDAFLFFVIALVASAAVLGYASLTLAGDEGAGRANAFAYAEDVRAALLRTTLEDPWYRNGSGERVELGQGVTVERFLLEEIQLLSRGLTDTDFSAVNSLILERAKSLVRPPFGIGLDGSLSGGGRTATLWLGDGGGPPADRFTASWTYDTVDGSIVRIDVDLWYT